jgi:hypothetical protein
LCFGARKDIIEQKGTSSAGIQLIQQCNQVSFIELKFMGELNCQLPDTVDELSKDWRLFIRSSLSVANSVMKFMSKRKPLHLNENFKATDGPEVGIQAKHREGTELGGAVPAIAAMDQHRGIFSLNEMYYSGSRSQYALDV